MSDVIYAVEKQIKALLRDKSNTIIILIIVVAGLSVYNLIETKNQIQKLEKKVDFRYFNTTTSLEQIHNVKINTYNGELK